MQIDFAGALCGLFYAGLLTAFTLLVFFAAVPFQNLWHVPVAACMAADDSLEYMERPWMGRNYVSGSNRRNRSGNV